MSETAVDTRKFITIKNSRVHNLKNVSVSIPRNKLTVITGVSGSGKSSLAFDTLFAEGQRRYAESLSAYVRQFIGRMDKPDVDDIKGISPAIAIEQKVNSRNPRSTVGTSTEIYDYLKLLYARIGITLSPISGQAVKRNTVTDVVDFLLMETMGSRWFLLAPLRLTEGRPLADEFAILMQKGFSRILHKGEMVKIEDAQNSAFEAELSKEKEKPVKAKSTKSKKAAVEQISAPSPEIQEDPMFILIDRFEITDQDDLASRIADSVQIAFAEGMGECRLLESEDAKHGKGTATDFSNKFELDGITFEEPSVHLFSFNNPYGACKRCEGFGQVTGIEESLVVPDQSLSIYQEAIACWKGEKMREWNERLILQAYKFDFPIHRPYKELTAAQRELLWTGNSYFEGLNQFFKHLEEQSYKIQYRVMLSRYRGRTSCPDCRGTRLRKDASYVKVCGKSISELVLMQVRDGLAFFRSIVEERTDIPVLSSSEKAIAKRILLEIGNRLNYLDEVGLGYLTLNRLSNTLSGGESQRINLATALGSSLVGSMYILDEPSIGLHPRDTMRLIGILKALRDLGNTVIVVEHDEEIMRAADHLLDLGPGAGSEGGTLTFDGSLEELMTAKNSLTADYLTGRLNNTMRTERRKWNQFIDIHGARENNLQNINVRFPLNVMSVITGVSGSGKSSLVKTILYPALKKHLNGFGEAGGKHDSISGDMNMIKDIEFVDQNPIGKSSRSNPVTYIKAYDDIRSIFAAQALAVTRGYKPSHFSFNVDGGRCEVCEGSGVVIIEMQFMADIHLTCETCNGKQFRDEVLDVMVQGKNIHDILCMTVDESIQFFGEIDHNDCRRIVEKLKPLAEVGLGYVRLGQPASTLSGGEAQRIKLATFFSKENSKNHTLFLFDEPTTGLHFHDINKLLYCFDRLVAAGNTVLIIEHNPEIIRNADWVIDLGPDGGDGGGQLVFAGTPEDLVLCKESATGAHLVL